jgi:hypothetical protein
MPEKTPTHSGLELTELELVVVALAEHTIACRQAAVAKRRAGDEAGADEALQELMRTGVLQNRLALELMDRTPRLRPALEQCDGCGAVAGRPHASDCDRVQP